MVSKRSLWRHGNFLKFWAAQSISLVGTQITALALPLTAILVLKATAVEVGLLATMQYLPFLLFTLLAGGVVDRLPQIPVLVTADFARAVLLGAVPVLSWLGTLHLYMLYPIAFIVGVLSVFFDVAHQSYLPSLVDSSQLLDGNSKLNVSYSTAQLAGPGLGGLLVQALTAPVTVLFDAFSYIGSAILLLLIRRPGDASQKASVNPAFDLPGLAREIRQGVRYVFGHALIKPLAFATGLSNFFYLYGMTGAILVLYAVRQLHMTPALLGLVLAIGNAGAVFGSVIGGRVLGRWRLGPLMVVTVASGAIATALMAVATPADAVPLLAAGVLIGEMGAFIYNIGQLSLRQAVTPPELQGRMNATVRFINWGPIPVGAFLGGLIGQEFGLRTVLWVATAGSLLPAVPLLLSMVVRLRTMPAPVSVTAGAASE